MRLNPCPTAALRLCNGCARNPDNQPAWARKHPLREITPTTRGERCADWIASQPKPAAAPAD